MAHRRTRAQQQWRPGQTRPPRSVKALFASTVLCLEGALIFFFGLAAWGLNQNEWYAWWIFGGLCALAVVAVLACAVLHKPYGYRFGWVLQFVMIAAFVAVAVVSEYGMGVALAMLPGLAFLGCWWFAVTKGEEIDREKMERYLAEEEREQAGENRGSPAEAEGSADQPDNQ